MLHCVRQSMHQNSYMHMHKYVHKHIPLQELAQRGNKALEEDEAIPQFSFDAILHGDLAAFSLSLSLSFSPLSLSLPPFLSFSLPVCLSVCAPNKSNDVSS